MRFAFVLFFMAFIGLADLAAAGVTGLIGGGGYLGTKFVGDNLFSKETVAGVDDREFKRLKFAHQTLSPAKSYEQFKSHKMYHSPYPQTQSSFKSAIRKRIEAQLGLTKPHYARVKAAASATKRTRRTGSRGRVPRAPGGFKFGGFPDRMVVNLISNHVGTCTSVSTGLTPASKSTFVDRINVSGCVNPFLGAPSTGSYTFWNTTSAANEPLHWSSYASAYSKYRVLSATVTQTWYCCKTIQLAPILVWMALDHQGTKASPNDEVVELMNDPHTTSKMLLEDDSKKVVIRKKYKMRTATPYIDSLCSVVTTNPTETEYMMYGFTQLPLNTTGSDNVAMSIPVITSIVYEVEFFERNEVGRSS